MRITHPQHFFSNALQALSFTFAISLFPSLISFSLLRAQADPVLQESGSQLGFEHEFQSRLSEFSGSDLESRVIDNWNDLGRENKLRLIFDIDNWQANLEARRIDLYFEEARGDSCHVDRLSDLDTVLGDSPDLISDELDALIRGFNSLASHPGSNLHGIVDSWISNDEIIDFSFGDLLNNTTIDDGRKVRASTVNVFRLEIIGSIQHRRKLLVSHINAIDAALLYTQNEISDFFRDLKDTFQDQSISTLDTKMSENFRVLFGEVDFLGQEIQKNRDQIIRQTNIENDRIRKENKKGSGGDLGKDLLKIGLNTAAGKVPGVGDYLPGAIDAAYAIGGVLSYRDRKLISSLDPHLGNGGLNVNLSTLKDGPATTILGLRDDILVQIEVNRTYLREMRNFALRSPSILKSWQPIDPEDPDNPDQGEALANTVLRSVRQAYWSLFSSLLLTLEIPDQGETISDFGLVAGAIGPQTLISRAPQYTGSTVNLQPVGTAGDGRLMVTRGMNGKKWFHRNIFSARPYFIENSFYGINEDGDLLKLSFEFTEASELKDIYPIWNSPINLSEESESKNPNGYAFAGEVTVIDSLVFGIDARGHLLQLDIQQSEWTDLSEAHNAKEFKGPVTAVKDPSEGGDEITIVGVTTDGNLGQFNTMEDGSWKWFDLSHLPEAPFQGFEGSITAVRPNWELEFLRVVDGQVRDIIEKKYRLITIMGRSSGGSLILLESSGGRENPDHWRWRPLGGTDFMVDDPNEPFQADFGSPVKEGDQQVGEIRFHGLITQANGIKCMGTQAVSFELGLGLNSIKIISPPPRRSRTCRYLDQQKFGLRLRNGPWLEDVGINKEWLNKIVSLLSREGLYRLLAHEDGDFGEMQQAFARVYDSESTLQEIEIPVEEPPVSPNEIYRFVGVEDPAKFSAIGFDSGDWDIFDTGSNRAKKYVQHFLPNSEYIYLVGDNQYLRLPINEGRLATKSLDLLEGDWIEGQFVRNSVFARRLSDVFNQVTYEHASYPEVKTDFIRVSNVTPGAREDWRQVIGSRIYDLEFLGYSEIEFRGGWTDEFVRVRNSALGETFSLHPRALTSQRPVRLLVDADKDIGAQSGVRWDQHLSREEGGCGAKVSWPEDPDEIGNHLEFNYINVFSRDTGSKIIVPGETVWLEVGYKLWCDEEIQEREEIPLVFGIEDTPIRCNWSGAWRYPPKYEIDNTQVAFEAPAVPGTYNLYVTHDGSAGGACEDGLNAYGALVRAGKATLVATFTVSEERVDPCIVDPPGADNDCDRDGISDSCQIEFDRSLDLDEDGQLDGCVQSGSHWLVRHSEVYGADGTNEVEGGEPVAIDFDFLLRNPPTCESCLVQFVVGYENTAVECVFDGNTTTTFKSHSKTVIFDAPMEPGEYTVYVTYELQFNCGDAKNLFSAARATGNRGGAIGTFTVIGDAPSFRRGDDDGNGVLEITDPISNVTFQFLGTFTPPCLDASDFDDNGKIEITDPIANLSYQFLGTAPPAPPGADTCGQDPTPDEVEGADLGCLVYDQC